MNWNTEHHFIGNFNDWNEQWPSYVQTFIKIIQLGWSGAFDRWDNDRGEF